MLYRQKSHEELVNKELRDIIDAGGKFTELPKLFSEHFKIVPPKSRAGQSFQHYMEKLTKMLLPDYDFSQEPILFALSDDDKKNAFVIKGTEPKIICFTKGIIKGCENLNELAYILGHELSHIQYAKARGSSHVVTEIEEIYADLPQLHWMYEHANLDPRTAMYMLSKLRDELEEQHREKTRKRLEKYGLEDYESKVVALDDVMIALEDEHASPAVRASYVAQALAGYEQAIGEFKKGRVLGIHKEDYGRILRAKHTPYIETAYDIRSFSQMDADKQIAFIIKEIEGLEWGHSQRPKAIKELFEHINNKPGDASSIAAGNKLIEILLEKPFAFNDLYPAVAVNLFDKKPTTPLGAVAELAEATASVVYPKSEEACVKGGERLLAILPRFRQLSTGSLKQLDISRFVLPENFGEIEGAKKKIPIPWHRQAQWAIKLAEQGDATLANALLFMGVQHEKLYQVADTKYLNALLEARKAQRPGAMMLSERERYYSDYSPIIIPDGMAADASGIKYNNETGYIEKKPYSPSQGDDKIIDPLRAELAVRLDPTLASDQQRFTVAFTPPSDIKDIFTDRFWSQEIPKITPPALISSNHIGDMFAKSNGYIGWSNDNNPAHFEGEYKQHLETWVIRCREFTNYLTAEASKPGSKQAIRSFFLGRGDGRDISHVLNVARLPVTHPFMQFMLQNPEGIFSDAEKAKLMFSYSRLPDKSNWWCKLFECEAPESQEQLVAFCKAAYNYSDSLKKAGLTDYIDSDEEDADEKVRQLKARERDTIEFRGDPVCETHDNVSQFKQIVGDTIKKTIAALQQSGSLDEVKLLLDVPDILTRFDIYGKEEIVTSLMDALRKREEWPQDIVQTARLYKAIDNNDLIPDYSWNRSYVKRMFEGIDSPETTHEKKQEALEALLLGDVLKDPRVLKRTIRRWTTCIRDDLQAQGLGNEGRDDGSEKYYAAVLSIIKKVAETTPHSLRVRIFTELADELVTQKGLSGACREYLDQFDLKAAERQDFYVRSTEALLRYAREEPRKRRQIIDFLLQKTTKKGVESFAELLSELSRDPTQNREDKEHYILKARRMREAFWEAPFAGRVTIMNQLLHPPVDQVYDEKDATANPYKDAMNYVIREFLPDDMPHSLEAWVYLKHYSECIPIYQRGLFLCAILAAQEKAKAEDKQLSIGERLILLLELMGPAEAKAGQKIHSHREVPEDIRKGAKRTKSMLAKPTRWDLHERIDAVVPEEIKENLEYVGAISGAASYYVSTPVREKNGDEGQLRMLRENALSRAELGFNRLREFANRLVEKERSFLGGGVDTTIDIIDQAQRMCPIETSSEIGYQQYKQAASRANGVTVKVGDYSFDFYTAAWKAYGVDQRGKHKSGRWMETDKREFAYLETVPGDHFNDLPDTSPEQFAYKKALATGYVAYELSEILSGKPFDHDRHGAQTRVHDISLEKKTGKMGMFDHGCMALEAPTVPEKKQLATAIINCFEACQQEGVTMAGAMYQEMRRVQLETGTTPKFLVKVQEALLALSDFIGEESKTNGKKSYLTQDELKGIMITLVKQNMVDPVIVETLSDRIADKYFDQVSAFFEDKDKFRTALKGGQIGDMLEMLIPSGTSITITPENERLGLKGIPDAKRYEYEPPKSRTTNFPFGLGKSYRTNGEKHNGAPHDTTDDDTAPATYAPQFKGKGLFDGESELRK